jgi:hypothetical protein
LNDIGRNSLLGNGKKIAKFLMSTFTYRSTFLYAKNPAFFSCCPVEGAQGLEVRCGLIKIRRVACLTFVDTGKQENFRAFLILINLKT